MSGLDRPRLTRQGGSHQSVPHSRADVPGAMPLARRGREGGRQRVSHLVKLHEGQREMLERWFQTKGLAPVPPVLDACRDNSTARPHGPPQRSGSRRAGPVSPPRPAIRGVTRTTNVDEVAQGRQCHYRYSSDNRLGGRTARLTLAQVNPGEDLSRIMRTTVFSESYGCGKPFAIIVRKFHQRCTILIEIQIRSALQRVRTIAGFS